jgi:hypothetical protein
MIQAGAKVKYCPKAPEGIQDILNVFFDRKKTEYSLDLLIFRDYHEPRFLSLLRDILLPAGASEHPGLRDPDRSFRLS